MTVKTTSQGVLQCQIWSLSGGLWPGDGSSKKVRGEHDQEFAPDSERGRTHWSGIEAETVI